MKKTILLLMVIIAASFYSDINAQSKRAKDIVQKGGSKITANSSGQFTVKIPEGCLSKIKASPNKYKLKITIVKIPAEFYKAKTKNAKPGEETKFSFTLAAKHGTKLTDIGKFATSIKDINKIAEASLIKSQVLHFNLTEYANNTVTCNLNFSGEPVPGAEIYVELEPDDEP